MTPAEKRLKILDTDSWLLQAESDVIARHARYELALGQIRDWAGSIEEFASAYHYFGIHYLPEKHQWVYREWAPEADGLWLTGDFNRWNQHSHPLKKIENGVWEIYIHADHYADRFVHGSKLKVIVKGANGTHLRIPAYITRVVQDNDTKNYSGQLWQPAPFDWKNDGFAFDPKQALLIYEAHVGMAQEQAGVGSYRDFEDQILPRIKKAGYNAVQLMAIQEHPYYGSFGYHVSNFFAPSSRFGTPEELKSLIRKAHQMDIAVIMDLVHSHTVKNLHEGLNQFDGSDHQYFHAGARGLHPNWDSMLFDYGKKEVKQFLLSNIRYWIEEFHFDGFRFDGVGSMLYFHHGDGPMDHISKYFTDGVEWDAVTYLQLANTLAHRTKKGFVTIAEDVSGMAGLAFPVEEGGIGFDYRLGMGLPDFWIKYLQDIPDEEWNLDEMWKVLNDRLHYVPTVAYCESHDQALVGDKTIAFRLMDKEMYFHMASSSDNLVVDRGMALHKMIRLLTITVGGDAYLNFMGNEFGHPEWIDFPREGNNWSYQHARRQWSLVDNPILRYHYLADFDRDMIALVKKYQLLDGFAQCIHMDHSNKVLAYTKSGLIFLFNFNTQGSIPGYELVVPQPGEYRLVLNTDEVKYGGHGRVDSQLLYPATLEGDSDKAVLRIYSTNRSALVLEKV